MERPAALPASSFVSIVPRRVSLKAGGVCGRSLKEAAALVFYFETFLNVDRFLAVLYKQNLYLKKKRSLRAVESRFVWFVSLSVNPVDAFYHKRSQKSYTIHQHPLASRLHDSSVRPLILLRAAADAPVQSTNDRKR